MNNDLPIKVDSKGLFEAGDKSSKFLMTKLEAWLNFKALSANWYADESLVISMSLTLLPEVQFLNQQVDNDKQWLSISEKSVTAIYTHYKDNHSFESYIMFSNEELNKAMENPRNVENMLQIKLASAANKMAQHYHLMAI